MAGPGCPASGLSFVYRPSNLSAPRATPSCRWSVLEGSASAGTNGFKTSTRRVQRPESRGIDRVAVDHRGPTVNVVSEPGGSVRRMTRAPCMRGAHRAIVRREKPAGSESQALAPVHRAGRGGSPSFSTPYRPFPSTSPESPLGSSVTGMVRGPAARPGASIHSFRSSRLPPPFPVRRSKSSSRCQTNSSPGCS